MVKQRIGRILREQNGLFNGVRTVFMDIISSISRNGKIINTKTVDGAEMRDIRVMTPYGIASCGLDGMQVEVVVHGNGGNMIAVYDRNKPDIKPGEIILYSKYGEQVRLTDDGITLIHRDGRSITFDQLYNAVTNMHTHS